MASQGFISIAVVSILNVVVVGTAITGETTGTGIAHEFQINKNVIGPHPVWPALEQSFGFGVMPVEA
ncbi:hypothetical protein D3C79_1037300 [compost metagenome]